MPGAIDILRRHNLIRRGKANAQTISFLPRRTIHRIADEITDECRLSNIDTPAGRYSSHCSSLSFSGHRRGHCATPECRLEAATRLARFALMYSDHVYICNFFADYDPSSTDTSTLSDLRSRLSNDIGVFLALQPVIRAGAVTLVTPALSLCADHSAEVRSTSNRLARAQQKLAADYAIGIKAATIQKFPDGYLVACQGPETLLHHGHAAFFGPTLPSFLKEMPSLRRRVEGGKLVAISRTNVRKLGIHRMLASRVGRDTEFGLVFAPLMGASFVTDSELHVRFLEATSHDTKLVKRNRMIAQHLTSVVPFLDDLPLGALIKLRKQEGDAFISYRKALKRAIDESCGTSAELSAQNAQQIYADVLEPELTTLSTTTRVRGLAGCIGGSV